MTSIQELGLRINSPPALLRPLDTRRDSHPSQRLDHCHIHASLPWATHDDNADIQGPRHLPDTFLDAPMISLRFRALTAINATALMMCLLSPSSAPYSVNWRLSHGLRQCHHRSPPPSLLSFPEFEHKATVVFLEHAALVLADARRSRAVPKLVRQTDVT